MLKKITQSIREYKTPSILTFLFIVMEAIIECLIPFITADMVNDIKAGTEISLVIQRGVILILMAGASLACGGIAGVTSARASAGFAKNLRADMFARIQTYSFENIDGFSTASLVTRMTTDVQNVQMAYMMMIRIAVRAPLMLLFSIIMAYIMGGSLATSFVVIVPFLAFGLFLVSRRAMPAFRRVFKKYDRLNESIEENVRAMRVVKGFSREEHEIGKFARAAEEIRDDFTRAERIVALNSPIMQICVYFNMIFVLIVGSRLVISSGGVTLGVGEISAMMTYGMQILIQLMMLSMIYVILTISAESIKRVAEVLATESTLSDPPSPVTSIADGTVEFSGVSFKYSKDAREYALSGIDLRIESGMTVGIIGGTGSSKTSLVSLIPRLYDVTEGSVKVGGVDVRAYALESLRRGVAVVLQKNTLFSGTIAQNLRWGNPDATDAELEEACKLACAHEFVVSFPDGYNTKIEQGGTNVSGGQRQRLCIARALLARPKVLILDDSTSAVDMKTDAQIRAGFSKFIPETTKIIIAQRIASVEHADMIIVMDGGSVSAIGTHGELIETCDIYREVYEQQTKGGDEDAE